MTDEIITAEHKQAICAKAYATGKADYAKGVLFTANPYLLPFLRAEWDRGWADAAKEANEKVLRREAA